MQDDEEFLRKYTQEEVEKATEFARNLYSKTDPAAIGKFVDLSSRQAEVMQDVITKLAAVTAQRDELLAALKGITYKDGEDYFTAIQDGVPLREVRHAIAKCEVQNG